ncbi:sulfatase family protein [Chitinophaga cymbidii]|uniref:Heparan N-sulfatase n=1 Tax=Chitinophaga cymbidii TaxID=1096750 RepID=A0A512RL20_9BACT|nr:sulfatase [Chitinophaga cymbidii]GEP96350.1 heparan N-sulfatase [Chitinophaga cymbidii]
MHHRIRKVLIGLMFLASSSLHAQQQPNIILIIGDDISQEDIGCYGNPSIRTPHIDRLAANGLKFTNAFVTSSSCSPSRCSIISGRYPHNTGAAELHNPLPAHLAYFPELLKNAGYYTALAGKWHEGPNTKRAYDTLMGGKKINGDGGEEQWLNLIAHRPKNKPFFFWLAPFDAHRNWGADNNGSWQHHPDSVTVPPTLIDNPATRRDIASYYNEIGRLDYYLGELNKALEQQGIADNTLIIFMADNARPFPGSKTRLYDRGVKTPFILQWPKSIARGGVCSSLVSSIDIASTLLELAGLKPAETFQGKSFAKLLRHPEQPFRNYVFAEHNWHDYEACERSVRTKDFFYLLNLRPQLSNVGAKDVNTGASALALHKAAGNLTALQADPYIAPRPAEELYDLKNDPAQEHNLVNDPAYKKQLAELKKILSQWRTQTADTTPEQLSPDWYDRRTSEPVAGRGKRGEMPGAAKQADRVNHKGPF